MGKGGGFDSKQTWAQSSQLHVPTVCCPFVFLGLSFSICQLGLIGPPGRML